MYVRSENNDIIAINAADYSNLYYGLYWFETMEQAGYRILLYIIWIAQYAERKSAVKVM